MKTLIIITAILFLSAINISAQPNGGFENWSPYFGTENPDNWGTLNILTMIGNAQSVFKASSIDKHSGNYALKINTVYLVNKPDFNALKDTMGVVFTGGITLSPQSINYGFPYTLRPEKLEFWSKYNPIGNDSAGAQVFLRKWDGSKHDTIAFGEIGFVETPSYTNFQVNLTYYSSDSPDSAIIAFASSLHSVGARVGSTLFVDDVALIGSVGIGEPNKMDGIVKISPNPSKDEVNIKTSLPNSDILKINDISGKLIGEFKIYNNEFIINTAAFPFGIYFYEIQDNKAKTLYKGKLNVVK